MCPNGTQTTNESEAKDEAIKFYKTLLGILASNPYLGIETLRNVIHKRIPSDQIGLLEEIPTENDIKK